MFKMIALLCDGSLQDIEPLEITEDEFIKNYLKDTGRRNVMITVNNDFNRVCVSYELDEHIWNTIYELDEHFWNTIYEGGE